MDNRHKTKKILLTLTAILLITGAAYATSTLFATTTNTVTVGNTLLTSNMAIQFDTPDSSAGTACTQSGTTWTCPQSVIPGTVFSGDYITYSMQLESEKVGETPTVATTTTPTYAGLTTTFQTQLFTCGQPTTVQPSQTTIQAFTSTYNCENVWVTYTINGMADSFSLTTNING